MRRSIVLVAMLFASALGALSNLRAQDKPPDPPREFRGVWVASVANIDWPSKKGLSSPMQQGELLAILDKAAELKLNAVIFQVRPMCDALYESKLEPWSEYLTGTLGTPPSPAYDPLQVAVREAHARGLELHVWFNPYRAHHPSATSPIPENHLIKCRPDLAKRYGTHYWLNPTSQEVQDHTLRVILDVVRRYDIDGVHIDDYFYPYKEEGGDGRVIPFPDDDTWAAYQKTGGALNRDDWRRDAINRFIERMYREVKQAKPWVKVGISPFGIWRPGNPAGIAGFDPYAEIYADSRLWLKEGWCDYLAPQLYWPIKQEKQSFPRLLAWWCDENSKGRHLWPGFYTSRVTGTDNGWRASEIIEQIKLTRLQAGATGHIHFSMRALMDNTGGIADALAAVYTESALVPATPWAGLKEPVKPNLRWEKQGTVLAIRASDGGIRLYVIRIRQEGKWTIRIRPIQATDETRVRIEGRPDRILVSAVDRAGVESVPAEPSGP
ncbi:MAG TPA: family 10 glycosylhydrolase [Pirellulales bacterium]|nr:family 10 glycosylhydrolase [Pirellulales bacterium]